MKIDQNTVEYIAQLAKLSISTAEKGQVLKQLNRVLDYMALLDEVNTDHIEPTAHVMPLENVLRQDSVQESQPQSDSVDNAPQIQDNCFVVPKVI